MADDLTAGNPAGDTTGNPSDPAAASGTSNQTGEASGQGATGQDSFIPKGLDLNTLPPHVRAQVEKINSDMVRGFTEKTTKLSETAKQEAAKMTESFKQKAELYDQLAGQEEFVKMWNDHVAKTGQPPTPDPADPVAQLSTKLQQMEQKIAESELIQVTDSFADAVNEKGEKLHPDFDKLNSLVLGKTQKGQEVTFLRAFTELSTGKTHQERLANGYKAAKAFHEQIFEEGRKAGLGRTQTKLMNGSSPPTNINGNFQVTEKRPKSAHEALEMAKKGIAVSR